MCGEAPHSWQQRSGKGGRGQGDLPVGPGRWGGAACCLGPTGHVAAIGRSQQQDVQGPCWLLCSHNAPTPTPSFRKHTPDHGTPAHSPCPGNKLQTLSPQALPSAPASMASAPHAAPAPGISQPRASHGFRIAQVTAPEVWTMPPLHSLLLYFPLCSGIHSVSCQTGHAHARVCTCTCACVCACPGVYSECSSPC